MPRRLDRAEVERWVGDGVWRTNSLLHVLDAHVEADGDRLAVADQHQRFSYREFADRTATLASWLVSLGLPSGAVVAVQSPSCVSIPLMHFACNRADLTFLPLSDAWRAREVGHLLKRSKARVAIVPNSAAGFDFVRMVNGLRADLPDLGCLASFGPSGDVDLNDVLTRRDRHWGTGLEAQNEPRMCMVTSGTSGLPKISLYTDNNLWYFLSTYRSTLSPQGPETFASIAPANTGSTGYIFPVLSPLLFGSSCVMLEHWNPVDALNLLQNEQVGVAVAVPTQLIKMLDVVKHQPFDLTALRALSNAGAPMPPEVAAEIEAAMNCAVLPMYGATDGGVPTMTTVSDPPEKRYSSVGRVLPHTDFRIADANGVAIEGAGARGEVQWRNPIKTFGYLNDDEQTAAAFTAEGLYRSGDLGMLDNEGYLHIVGRAKDLIIRGGQNISPREIEDIVVQMDEVLEVAVVGTPDAVYGERICLCVVPKDRDLTLEAVVKYLQAREFAPFMMPERLEFFDEFPNNSGGKVSKLDLIAMVRERDA